MKRSVWCLDLAPFLLNKQYIWNWQEKICFSLLSEGCLWLPCWVSSSAGSTWGRTRAQGCGPTPAPLFVSGQGSKGNATWADKTGNGFSLFQMFLTVYLSNSEQHFTEVPVTPETICRDVVDLCKEPGENDCHLAEVWCGSGMDPAFCLSSAIFCSFWVLGLVLWWGVGYSCSPTDSRITCTLEGQVLAFSFVFFFFL